MKDALKNLSSELKTREVHNIQNNTHMSKIVQLFFLSILSSCAAASNFELGPQVFKLSRIYAAKAA